MSVHVPPNLCIERPRPNAAVLEGRACAGKILHQVGMSCLHLERRNLNGENVSVGLTCRRVCRMFCWLIIDVGRPSSLRALLSWAGDLGCDRKQADKAIRCTPVSSTPPWLLLLFLPPTSGFCSDFPWSELWTCKENNPSPPQVAFGHSVLPQQ